MKNQLIPKYGNLFCQMLLVLGVTMGSVFADTVRSMPPGGYVPGTDFTVKLVYTKTQSADSVAVEDYLPRGWTAKSATSSTGAVSGYDAVNNKVKFVLDANVTTTMSYVVSPPAAATGPKIFTATTSLDGVSTSLATTISEWQPSPEDFHPADLNQDLEITLDEYSAYLDAFVNEDEWSVPPSPVTDIDILSRGLQILIDGDGHYVTDINETGTLRWVPALPGQ